MPTPETRLEQAVAHAQFLRSVARAVLGGDAQAEDVLQETFLVAWQSEPRKAGALKAWLAGVVRRLALSRRRSVRRREAREAHAAVAETLPSVEEVALREEARQALVAALLALEEPYRTTLMWRYYSGRSVADIAALQAVPVNTVRTRIQRGLARLRVGLSAAHAGDDRRWRSALLPLAGSGIAVGPTAGAVLGGLLVKKALAGGLAALLLVAAGVAWWTDGSDRPALDGTQREPLAASELGPTMTGSSGPHLEGRASDAVERPTARGPSRYAGQVVDRVGRMVAGARVEVRGICNDEACASLSTGVVEGEPLAEARTTAEGLFQLPSEFERWDPRPHAVWVHVLADGFALAEAGVVRDRPARIVLAPGGTLALTLLNAEGRAARGAKVALYRGEAEIPAPGWGGIPLVWAGAAAEDGRLEQGLAPGAYRVRITAAGSRPIHTEALHLVEGGRIERTITMDAGIVLHVGVTGPDGLPLAGARVRALGPLGSSGEARTDPEGHAVVPGIGLPLGESSPFRHAVHALRVHYAVEAEGLAGVYGWRLLPPGPDRVQVEARLVPGVQLRVQVVDPEGARVPGALVRWEPPLNDASQAFLAEFVPPGPDGWIVLPRVRAGERGVEVKAQSDAWVARTVPVVVTEPEERLTVVLARSDGVLAGRVLLPDGSPASEGRVHYEPESEPGKPPAHVDMGPIGTDGTFQRESLPTGKGVVAVQTPGRAIQRFPVVVVPAGAAELLSLRLRSGRPLRGRIVDRAGAGLAGATVGMQMEVPWTRGGAQISSFRDDGEVKTGPEGRFEIEVEEGQVLRLVPTLKGWRVMQGNPEQTRVGETDVVLRMKPDAEPWGLPLHLRVTSGTKPYTGALDVMWEHAKGNRMALRVGSDDKGLHHFGIWGEPGRFTLTLHAPGHRPTLLRDLLLDETPEGTTREVALDRGAVFALRVRDGAGRPLADAQVDVHGSTLRLDARGEVEVGGFEREGPAFDLSVVLSGDREFTVGSVRIGERSGTYDVLLRRTGVISVRLPEDWASVREELHVRAVAGDGQLLSEIRYPSERVQAWRGTIRAELRVPVDGTCRVLSTLDGRSGESVVEAALGKRVETNVELGAKK